MAFFDYFSKLGASTYNVVTQPKTYVSTPSTPRVSVGGGGTTTNTATNPNIIDVLYSGGSQMLGMLGGGVRYVQEIATPVTKSTTRQIIAANVIANPVMAAPAIALATASSLLQSRQAPTIRQEAIMPSSIDTGKLYAVSYRTPGKVSAGADFSKTVFAPGLALQKPQLNKDTLSFQTGIGSRYGPTIAEKEGNYTYVGPSAVTQHGQTDTGWLFKSTQGLYFLAQPPKSVSRQSVTMSGGEGAWSGMLVSGKAKVESLLPIPSGAVISGIRDVGDKASVTPTLQASSLPKPFTSIPTAKESGAGWKTVSEALRPSDFSLEVMKSVGTIPIIGGFAAKNIVQTSDFWLSGTNPIAGTAKAGSQLILGRDIFSRYTIKEEVGPASLGKKETTIGQPSYAVEDLGGGSFRITTTTPITETQKVTTPYRTTMTPVEGGFEWLERGVSEKVKSVLPAGSETAFRGFAMLTQPSLAFSDVGAAIVSKTTGMKAAAPSSMLGEFYLGQYEGLREKPLTAGASYALGIGLGAGFGLLESATLRGAAIAGTRYPTATRAFTAINTRILPGALAAVYGADVLFRSEGDPRKLGSILSTEVAPLTLGGMTWANRARIAPGIRSTFESIDAALPNIQQRAIRMPAGYETGLTMRASPELMAAKKPLAKDIIIVDQSILSGKERVVRPVEKVRFDPTLIGESTRQKTPFTPFFEGTTSGKARQISELKPEIPVLDLRSEVSLSKSRLSKASIIETPGGIEISLAESALEPTIKSSKYGGWTEATRKFEIERGKQKTRLGSTSSSLTGTQWSKVAPQKPEHLKQMGFTDEIAAQDLRNLLSQRGEIKINRAIESNLRYEPTRQTLLRFQRAQSPYKMVDVFQLRSQAGRQDVFSRELSKTKSTQLITTKLGFETIQRQKSKSATISRQAVRSWQDVITTPKISTKVKSDTIIRTTARTWGDVISFPRVSTGTITDIVTTPRTTTITDIITIPRITEIPGITGFGGWFGGGGGGGEQRGKRRSPFREIIPARSLLGGIAKSVTKKSKRRRYVEVGKEYKTVVEGKRVKVRHVRKTGR